MMPKHNLYLEQNLIINIINSLVNIIKLYLISLDTNRRRLLPVFRTEFHLFLFPYNFTLSEIMKQKTESRSPRAFVFLLRIPADFELDLGEIYPMHLYFDV